MKEYIEREAALNELEEELEYDTPFYTEEQNKFINSGLRIAIKDIKRLPAADVVEVVRCKDCLFGHRDYNYRLGYTCEKPLYHPAFGEKPHRKLMQDCDYCSHGVRKTD